MYKLTDTFVLILLIFAVFLSVAYTTLNKLFAVFFIYYLGLEPFDLHCMRLTDCWTRWSPARWTTTGATTWSRRWSPYSAACSSWRRSNSGRYLRDGDGGGSRGDRPQRPDVAQPWVAWELPLRASLRATAPSTRSLWVNSARRLSFINDAVSGSSRRKDIAQAI